jgi:hypothetical protein
MVLEAGNFVRLAVPRTHLGDNRAWPATKATFPMPESLCAGGYRVTVEDQAARAEALTATVALQGAGAEVAVAAGQGARVRTGEAPSDPVDLLLPGPLLRPEEVQVLQRVEFGWTSVDGALGYRFEVGDGTSFNAVVLAEDLGTPEYAPVIEMLPWPTDGSLYWRVSSFDRFGFQRIPSDARSMRLPTGVGR